MGTFITCAVTGGADTVSRHPRIPATPREIADAAISAAKAGAAIVHLHARDPQTRQQSRDPELFAEIVSLIRDSGTDVIINVSCGMAGDLVLTETPESQLAGPGTDLLGPIERLQHLDRLCRDPKLKPEICTLDCGSMNFGDGDLVYLAPATYLRPMAKHNPQSGEGGKMKDTMIGVDLAKSVFQLHGASMTGQVKFRKKLSRSQFLKFIADQSPAVVVMEACGSAHYWARQVAEFGHEVKLIAPQYVRPFVKRQKNDAADAEAIVIAAQRPEMRFVEPRSEWQQARAVLFRARDRLVHQRTELVNALRAVLYEYGHTIPQGIVHLKRIEALLR